MKLRWAHHIAPLHVTLELPVSIPLYSAFSFPWVIVMENTLAAGCWLIYLSLYISLVNILTTPLPVQTAVLLTIPMQTVVQSAALSVWMRDGQEEEEGKRGCTYLCFITCDCSCFLVCKKIMHQELTVSIKHIYALYIGMSQGRLELIYILMQLHIRFLQETLSSTDYSGQEVGISRTNTNSSENFSIHSHNRSIELTLWPMQVTYAIISMHICALECQLLVGWFEHVGNSYYCNWNWIELAVGVCLWV